MNRHYLQTFILGLSVMLGSCGLPTDIVEHAEQLTKKVEEKIEEANNVAETISTSPLVTEHSEIWVGPHVPIRTTDLNESSPESLNREIQFTIAGPIPAVDLFHQIAKHTELAVSVAERVQNQELSNITWSGSVKDALDYLTNRMGSSWQTRNGRIHVFNTAMETWTLFVPGVDAKWRGSVGLSGSAQGGSDGSSLQAQDRVEVSMDTSTFWERVEKTVGQMLSELGEMTIDTLSGEITVEDKPQVLQRIEHWVAVKNQSATSQVLVSIDLYEISRNKEATSNFNLSQFIEAEFGNKSVRLNFANESQTFGLQFKRPSSGGVSASQVELLLKKSKDLGRVSKLTSTVIRGLNGYPVPIFFGDEISYLERRERVESEGTSSVRMIPAKIQDGIAINMLPRILPDSNRLMLNLTVRTTRIKKIERFPRTPAADGSQIQLPNLESRSILLPAVLNSGELLFVAGLDTFRTSKANSSAITGKNSEAKIDQTSLVLLITPRILRPPIEFSGRRTWYRQNGRASNL